MGNRAAGGLYRKIRADERSVSEILGTVLIFSFVIFLSVGLIVIGLSAFQGATAQTEDRLAQDSMQEMGDRLHSLTGSQIDTATEFEFPTGTGDDINALDEGVVNITIETHSDYVGLVEASDASNSTEIDLGTIEHEAEDGTITAYQGGALFERQGDLIEILQEPTFDYRGDAIDLSFHSVDIDQISDAESITAKRLRKQSEDQSEKLREMMRPHWNLTGYSDIMAPVTITVTIESEYADAWQMYAQNRMTETPTVNRNGNEVEVVFDKFDGGLTFNTNQTFDDDVFYSGEAALTGLVNVSNATIGGSGGEVEVAEIDGHGAASPSPHYILGVYNETASEWMIYNTTDGTVRTLTGDVVTNPDFLDSPPTLSNNDTYQIDPKDTWTCVVDGDPSKTDHEEFVDYVDTSGEGCLSEPLVGDAPDDSVASPHFNVSFDDVRLAGSKNINTDDVVAGQDKIELDWTVENDYVSNGTTPVVLLFSEKGSSDWIPLEKADVTLNGTGDTASDTFTVNATGSANVTFQVATLDTNDKSQEIEIVKRPERGKFQIDSLSVNKNTLTAGEDLQVDVEINNTASISDTQLVELQFDDNSGPAAVAWKKVSVNAGTTKTVSINWTTTNAFNTSNGEVIAETYYDNESETNITIEEDTGANASFDVTIGNVSPDPATDGDTVTVATNVTNVGNETSEQDIALLANGNIADVKLNQNLTSNQSKTVSLKWDSIGYGGENIILTVASADDTNQTTISVQELEPAEFLIDSLTVPKTNLTASEDLQATAEINNTASRNETQIVEMQFDGTPVAWNEVSLSANAVQSVSLNWTTTNAFETSYGTVTVETYDDSAAESPIEIQKGMETNATFAVDIENVTQPIHDGDIVTVEANVTNVGNETTAQDIALLADGNIANATLNQSLSPGQSTTLSLKWDSSNRGGENVTLTVASADDTDSETVSVTAVDPPDYNIAIDDVTVDGDPNGAVDPGNSTVTVEATVSNSGDSESPIVWLEDFEDRVVAVDDSVGIIGMRASDPDSTSVTLQWNVPSDVNTTDPEITVAVDGDEDSEELDIESRFVVEDIQTTKVKSSAFSELQIEDDSTSGGFWTSDESEFTVDYEVNPTSDFDNVTIVFDGDGGVYDEQVSTTTDGTVTHSRNGEYGSTYDITAQIMDDGSVVETVTRGGEVADGDDPDMSERSGNLVDSVTFEATIENIGDTTVSDTVQLFDPAGNEIGDTSVSLDGGDDTTVVFNWVGPDRTGSVEVTTKDDSASERVIIERDGPVCEAVSYTEDSEGRYEISNVDQLQCINEHGLDEEYVLVDDIDASGTEHWNDGKGFDPIGPEGHDSISIPEDDPWETFSGEFDGNGHTIEGLYIDRPSENYVGLFGATDRPYDDVPVGYGSTVENVILEDVHVVGNMYVGGLAGQAGGEIINARAEGYVEADKQLVGGLIGLGAHADIDNRIVADVEVVGGNVPSHLSGVQEGNAKGIGGLIGRAAWGTEIATGYSTGDVTGPVNVGGIMGSSSLVDSEFEEMYSASTVTATAPGAEGGSIVGIVQSDGDRFNEDMYYDEALESSAWGEAERWTGYSIVDMDIDEVEQTDWIGRTTTEMQGLDVNEPGRLGNLDFEEDGGPWVAVLGDYPRFQWELEAEGQVGVDIDEDNLDPVVAGQSLTVPVTLTNSNYENVTQTIRLLSDGTPVDSTSVTITERTPGGNSTTKNVSLTWNTNEDDVGPTSLEVRSEDDTDQETIEIDAPAVGDYLVDSVSANDPTTAGDVLTVTADIRYNGSTSPSPELVTLQNFAGGVVDSTNVTGNTTVALTWDTSEGLISGGNITDSITVGTSDDTNTTQVTIEAAGDGEFNVTAVSTNAPITEGESLNVTAEIENTGTETGTQEVLLWDFDGNAVDIGVVSLNAGDSTTVDLTWQTAVGDNGTGTIEVITGDDTRTATVDITPAGTKQYTFEHTSVDDPTTAGETLNVTAEVSYNGTVSPPPSEPVTLQDFDGNVVDHETVSGNNTVTLQWDTSENLVTSGSISDDITVGTSDDIETEEVTINAAGDGDFQIQNLATNDPVTEGDTLDVTATVENVGSENGTQNVLLRDHGDNAVDITSVSLDAGNSTTVTLNWNTTVGDNGQDDITVTTMDDTATQQVTIEEQPEEQLDVAITEVRYNGSQITSGTTVEAGATLEADVTVSNATQQVTKPVWLEFDGDTVAFNSGVTVNAGSNTDVTLTWSVHEAMNGSDLVAKTGHDSDLFDLTIERVQTSTKPLTSPSGEPIDVDLEKIAVG
ncbi:GLUG domain protein [Halorhabdus utahensis DSM 12940]|uniref:GLUG domain protein n=1 Tax=Halorhabdus utahensis (strain DSM 12940 / JCM 11049 / AX-2) TaxID=519442 RepID=C7NRS2_HALUD|nr:CARDB domain-containing protein [Halorhabdus utahensis]ACV13027.1 GLUG domain protein [Halorhabdus utahensis DSM 12940]